MDHITSWHQIRAKVRGVVGRMIFGVLVLQLAAVPIVETRAADVSIAEFPFLLACDVGGVLHAYYLSRIDKDGTAVYMTPARQAGTITLTGKAKQVFGEMAGSCVGKTLEQLRAACQAQYLPR
jgi:hypothetical protein